MDSVKKKIIRKTGIVLLAVILLYMLVLLGTSIYINRHKQRIMDYAAQVAKENLNGMVSIGDIDISIWKNFPDISFTITDFAWKDTVRHQPLLTIRELSTSFNIFQVVFSDKTIRNLKINKGLLHIFTDSAGYSNGYLMTLKNKINTGEKNQSSGEINISNLSISDMDIVIEDKIKEKEISMTVHRLVAAINQDGNQMNILMQEQIRMKKGLGFNLVKGAYLENQTISAKWQLLFDLQKKKLSFGETNVDINQHRFLLAGHFIFDKIVPSFSIQIESHGLLYQSAEQIVTTAIREKLQRYELTGPLDIKAAINGSLLPAKEPSVEIICNTKNNSLHTSFANFNTCSFSGAFTNSINKSEKYSDSNSAITFTGFNASWGGIPVSAKHIAITNLDSPWLKADVHADAPLAALDSTLSLKELALENGQAVFDLSYDGALTKEGSPQVEKILGSIAIKDAGINYVPRGFDFTHCNGVIQLFSDSTSMRQFTCNYGNNQFTVTVEGSHMRGKFISLDTLKSSVITASVSSPAVNLGDFTALFGDKKTRRKGGNPNKGLGAVSRTIDGFIGNSVIDITLKAGSIKNQRLEGKNFETRIRFEPAQWILSKISLQVAGGQIAAKGKVLINTKANHRVSLNVTVAGANVSKLLEAFDDFGQSAVTHKELRGNFMTNTDLQLDISGAGHIVPSSLHGVVRFSLKDGSLQKFTPFERLKTFVFKNRNLDNVQFAEIKDQFDINGNAIYINRMEVQSSAFRFFIEGNYGLSKKNTDLLLQVPFSNLNDNSFSTDSTLHNKGTKERKKGNIWLRAVNDDDGKIKIKLTLNRKVKS